MWNGPREGGSCRRPTTCRSIRGVNIHDVLQAAENTLIQFGGHTMAAGLSLYPDDLARFTAVADAYL